MSTPVSLGMVQQCALVLTAPYCELQFINLYANQNICGSDLYANDLNLYRKQLPDHLNLTNKELNTIILHF